VQTEAPKTMDADVTTSEDSEKPEPVCTVVTSDEDSASEKTEQADSAPMNGEFEDSSDHVDLPRKSTDKAKAVTEVLQEVKNMIIGYSMTSDKIIARESPAERK
jgi:hypothetical protein